MGAAVGIGETVDANDPKTVASPSSQIWLPVATTESSTFNAKQKHVESA